MLRGRPNSGWGVEGKPNSDFHGGFKGCGCELVIFLNWTSILDCCVWFGEDQGKSTIKTHVSITLHLHVL